MSACTSRMFSTKLSGIFCQPRTPIFFGSESPVSTSASWYFQVSPVTVSTLMTKCSVAPPNCAEKVADTTWKRPIVADCWSLTESRAGTARGLAGGLLGSSFCPHDAKRQARQVKAPRYAEDPLGGLKRITVSPCEGIDRLSPSPTHQPCPKTQYRHRPQSKDFPVSLFRHVLQS